MATPRKRTGKFSVNVSGRARLDQGLWLKQLQDQNGEIVVHQVSFSWGRGRPVLQNCSFRVPAGQLWMLLGANGSGKSTLLKILAGLLTPDSGEVYVPQPTGFVFQNPDHQLLMPTVGADIAFGLVGENLSYAQISARVAQALAAVNLPHVVRRPIYALSGGQKQRIALAGAIARNPRSLILDEPTALLDGESQTELVALVRQIARERHLTVLWVTHRLVELDYADGAFLLAEGKIVDAGDPQRLKQVLTGYET